MAAGVGADWVGVGADAAVGALEGIALDACRCEEAFLAWILCGLFGAGGFECFDAAAAVVVTGAVVAVVAEVVDEDDAPHPAPINEPTISPSADETILLFRILSI